jgi:hypothetical protein
MPFARSLRCRINRGLPTILCTLAFFAGSAAAEHARAAERQVLAVVACDSYGDLRKQLGWLGTQIDNPGLAGMVESFLLLATQGRGLAGLDVKRPLGAVVTSDGTDIAVHGFVPVKDLAKLLAAIQGVTGPVDEDGDRRLITLPSGVQLQITEQDGWAVIAPAGVDAKAADPTPLLADVAKDYTLGIEAFPSRMSDAVRKQLEAAIERAAAASAAQGQPVDAASLKTGLDGLRQTESLSLGLAIDSDNGDVFVENRSVAVPGSLSATAFEALGKGRLTVATPAAADGGSPAVRAYVAQSISEASKKQVLEAIDQTLPADGGDSLTKTVAGLFRSLLTAMANTGGIDAALAVDTTAAADAAPPAVTAGLRVKDGPALEQQVKKLLGAKDALPPGVSVKFDAGKAGAANLHTITIDISDSPAAETFGKSLDLTLAVAPDYAFVLLGDDAPKRAEAALKASGRVIPESKPIANVQVAMQPVLAYAAKQGAGPRAAAAAERVADAERALLELFVRPIDRGIVTRLSADAGVLKAVAALSGAPQPPAGPGGVPLPRVPQGLPIPVPLPR